MDGSHGGSNGWQRSIPMPGHAAIRYLLTSRYTFDSRANRENPDAELCRIDATGGRSCIKVRLCLDSHLIPCRRAYAAISLLASGLERARY
jgi:hypothetical protein